MINNIANSNSSALANPYVNRVIIHNAKSFYGRKQELLSLYTRIGANPPQSMAIIGEYRTGKSSILWYIMQPENRRNISLNQKKHFLS